jgi:CRP-like cAMP-binding protein
MQSQPMPIWFSASTGRLPSRRTAGTFEAAGFSLSLLETPSRQKFQINGRAETTRFVGRCSPPPLTQADLVDQLLHSTEKRLARALLLLASYGRQDKPVRTVSPISQETLAELVGTTRSRINFFMNKFKRLGFVEYKDGLKVNKSLLAVVLHD